MRIVSCRSVQEIGHHDHLAAWGSRCRQQLCHPGIVAGAIANHDGSVRQEARNGRARFEQVWILVGIAQDAGHCCVGAGELLRDVTIEVFRGDNVDSLSGTLRRGAAREQGQQGKEDRQHAE
jgi:bacterioferritin-associated ferredoxin